MPDNCSYAPATAVAVPTDTSTAVLASFCTCHAVVPDAFAISPVRQPIACSALMRRRVPVPSTRRGALRFSRRRFS